MVYSNENALRIVWLLIKSNFKLFLSVVGVFTGLMFLELLTITNIGGLFGLIFEVLVFSTMLYVGFFVSRYNSENELIQKYKELNLKELLIGKLVDGLGVWLGFIFVFIILSIIIAIVAGIFSLLGDFGYLIAALITISVFFLLFFAYPAIMGEIIYLKGFGSSFKKTFSVFNIKFWKKIFTSKYVFFSFVWSLVMGSLITIIMIFVMIGLVSIMASLFYGSNMYAQSTGIGIGYVISSLFVSVLVSILVLFLNFYAGVSFSFAHSILSESNENSSELNDNIEKTQEEIIEED